MMPNLTTSIKRLHQAIKDHISLISVARCSGRGPRVSGNVEEENTARAGNRAQVTVNVN
jgi:hypothetical protein